MLLDSLRMMIRGDSVEFMDIVIQIIASLIVIFLVLPIHEFAHGWMANKLGDPTARLSGRLTLNPAASIDPLGALAILFVGFGWGKPVPVNPLYFRNRRRGMALTAMAGPLSNLLAAFVASFLSNLLFFITTVTGNYSMLFENSVVFYIWTLISYFIDISISLAVFNLIPIPPLDGSKILMSFLPDRVNFWIMNNQRFMMPLLLVLIYVGVLDMPIAIVSALFGEIIYFVSDIPFLLLTIVSALFGENTYFVSDIPFMLHGLII